MTKEVDLPLFLHERAAFSDFHKILSDNRDICERSVVHCFTRTEVELEAYLKLGCSIGITGWICDERRGQHLRDLMKMIPLDKPMVETDAPYLLPRNLEKKPSNRRNEPAFLPHIVKNIAKCMGKTGEDIAIATYKNTLKFFKL